MTPLHQRFVNDFITINARLLERAQKEEYGLFMVELTTLESLIRYTKSKLQSRTILDPSEDLDE